MKDDEQACARQQSSVRPVILYVQNKRGDSCLFVNEKPVLCAESWEIPTDPMALAVILSDALNAPAFATEVDFTEELPLWQAHYDSFLQGAMTRIALQGLFQV